MFKKDDILIGIAVSIATTVIIGALVKILMELIIQGSVADTEDIVRTRTVWLFGICANIFWLNYFKKFRLDKSMRGVVIGTALLALFWVVRFGKELMDNIS